MTRQGIRMLSFRGVAYNLRAGHAYVNVISLKCDILGAVCAPGIMRTSERPLVFRIDVEDKPPLLLSDQLDFGFTYIQFDWIVSHDCSERSYQMSGGVMCPSAEDFLSIISAQDI